MRSALLTNGRYEIHYRPLSNHGEVISFPCDAQGHVEMDELSERARTTYLYVRAVVGRDYAAPAVQPSELH